MNLEPNYKSGRIASVGRKAWVGEQTDRQQVSKSGESSGPVALALANLGQWWLDYEWRIYPVAFRRLKSALTQAALLTILAGAPLLAHSQQQRVLVMGATHTDPKTHVATMQPMASYIAEALRPLGIESVEILVVPDRAQMINLLRDKRIDWVSETAYGAAVLAERAGAELFLRKWSNGVAVYRSVFFARQDANIESLEDLRDRTIAFEHRNSTSAFFIPASMMIAETLPLDGLVTPREKPRAGGYGYVFSGNEYNTAIWVKLGLVDAGVLSSTDWVDEEIMPPTLREEMAVFAESPNFPRAIEVLRGDLEPKVKGSLRDALLSMHTDDAAAVALEAYQRAARFDELTAEDRDSLAEITVRLNEIERQFR